MTFSLLARLYSTITGEPFSSMPRESIRPPFVVMNSDARKRTPRKISIWRSMRTCSDFSSATAVPCNSLTEPPSVRKSLISLIVRLRYCPSIAYAIPGRQPDMGYTSARKPARRLEGNIVVQVARQRRRATGRAAGAAPHTSLAGITEAAILGAAIATSLASSAAAGTGIEHGQLTTEGAQDDLGGIALLSRLILPLSRLELPFHIDLRALPQETLADVHQPLVEDHDPVPLGAFATLAGLPVAPAFRCPRRQVADSAATLHRPNLRIPTEIADQDDLVDAACHDVCSRLVRLRSTTLTLLTRQAKRPLKDRIRDSAPSPRSRFPAGWRCGSSRPDWASAQRR